MVSKAESCLLFLPHHSHVILPGWPDVKETTWEGKKALSFPPLYSSTQEILVFALPINQGWALSTDTVNRFKETGIPNSWELNCSEKNGEDSLSLHMQVKCDVTWCGLLYFPWGMCVCVGGWGGWGGMLLVASASFSPFFPTCVPNVTNSCLWMTNYTHLPMND